MPLLIGIGTLASCLGLFAQTPLQSSDLREFEVASIKAVPLLRPAYTDNAGRQHTVFQFAPGGRLVVGNGTLQFLLTTAFAVKDFQVIGAPAWTKSERFDIEAKSATNTGPDGMLPMLQSLLAERFGLTYHWDTRDLPLYHLVIGKTGSRLREHVQGNCRLPGEPNIPPDRDNVFANLPCGRLNFLQPSRLLGGMVGVSPEMPVHAGLAGRQSLSTTLIEGLSSRVGRAVVDQTGLRSTYDIDFRWADESSPDDAPGPSIFSALQEQLGLRLEPAKGPVKVLVIDQVSKPSEN